MSLSRSFKFANRHGLRFPKNLSVVIPQDYVNYVELSWIDTQGVKRIIYPTTLTSNPSEMPVQDNKGIPIQDSFNNNIEGTSITEDRWKNNAYKNLNALQNDPLFEYDYYYLYGAGGPAVGADRAAGPERLRPPEPPGRLHQLRLREQRGRDNAGGGGFVKKCSM